MINKHLVEENLDLVKRASFKIKFPPLTTFDHDDFLQAGREALCKAAEKYDPVKNPNFRNYAYTKIRWGIIDQYRNQFLVDARQIAQGGEKASFEDINKFVDSEEYMPLQLTFEEKLEILDDVLKTLSPRQKEFIYKKYWLGMSQQEIADELKLAHTGVSLTLRNAIKKLRKALE